MIVWYLGTPFKHLTWLTWSWRLWTWHGQGGSPRPSLAVLLKKWWEILETKARLHAWGRHMQKSCTHNHTHMHYSLSTKRPWLIQELEELDRYPPWIYLLARQHQVFDSRCPWIMPWWHGNVRWDCGRCLGSNWVQLGIFKNIQFSNSGNLQENIKKTSWSNKNRNGFASLYFLLGCNCVFNCGN